MKKLLLLVFSVLSFSTYAQETPKWRTLTFTSIGNVSMEDGHLLPQFSVTLDYELEHGFSISSWNGMSYNNKVSSSWFSSQTTLDQKPIKNLTVGVGYLFTTNGLQTFVPVSDPTVDSELFLTLKVQYRIKL